MAEVDVVGAVSAAERGEFYRRISGWPCRPGGNSAIPVKWVRRPSAAFHGRIGFAARAECDIEIRRSNATAWIVGLAGEVWVTDHRPYMRPNGTEPASATVARFTAGPPPLYRITQTFGSAPTRGSRKQQDRPSGTYSGAGDEFEGASSWSGGISTWRRRDLGLDRPRHPPPPQT